jgi:hypothetical protein
VVAVSATVACASVTEVATVDLAEVVERDGVAFTDTEIPAGIVDRLARHRLLVIGETHGVREHAELMTALLEALHVRGFRQLLMEWPQAADWLLADFVNGARLQPDWEPPHDLNGGLIHGIRAFNAGLPEEQRLRVRGIDVNLSDYGGATAFRDLIQTYTGHLGTSGPVAAFLQAEYGTAKQQERSLEDLQAALAAQEGELSAAWGSEAYELVTEMVEVELVSVAVRANREDHYDLSVRLRESAMKRLTDKRLEGYAHRSVLNVGGNHAQKKHLKGTSQEWLGDYLVNRSSAVGGPTFVVTVVPARTAPGGGFTRFDLLDASPENELFRLMNEAWPEQTVFLPLDDPVFRSGGIPVNYESTVHVCALKEHYDAVLLYPTIHRVRPESSEAGDP